MLLHTHTHTHTIFQAHFTKNLSLPTTRSSQATIWLRYCHRPRQTKLSGVLFLSADLRHRFHYVIHEDESRFFIWNFLNPVNERINRCGSLWRISSSSVAFEENELLEAWPLGVRRSGCRCDTPGSSTKPPWSSQMLSLLALLRNSRCSKPVQISGLGTGTRLSYAHSSNTAVWGKNIQSGLLLCIWNRLSCSETLYISAP